MTLLLTLRGTPFLYYGEEIGMRDGPVKKGEIVDPVGKKYWPFNKGRDPERTPMQWSDAQNGGFSSAAPWLPVNPDYRRINVRAQECDPESLLSWVKNLIRLRKDHPALSRGSWEPVMRGENDLISYTRSSDSERIFVLLNFSDRKRVHPPIGNLEALVSTRRETGAGLPAGEIEVFPNEATVFLVRG